MNGWLTLAVWFVGCIGIGAGLAVIPEKWLHFIAGIGFGIVWAQLCLKMYKD